MSRKPVEKIDISIVLSGAAGQGVQTVEHLLLNVLKNSGYHVFATKEYMSRVRGGSNSTSIRVSNFHVAAYVDRIDILIPLSPESVDRLKWRMSPETVVMGEKEKISPYLDDGDRVILDIPFSEIAKTEGAGFFSNIVATGVLACLFDIDMETLEGAVKDMFSGKGDDVIEKNLSALRRGCDIGIGILKRKELVRVPENPKAGNDLLLSGAEAVGLGAIAGGCNFISSYPMSPSTGVLVFLARHGLEFGILAEQAEDEISAINMALGAWYAGARALVTTSGGGFDLMTEGVSLAGMIESPLVVHLAQRPGPATGLPTRTEQGDLNLALYGGHGEFPRVIFAPGTMKEAFELTARAFFVADRFQVPVFILTDQYLIDSYCNLSGLPPKGIESGNHFVKTDSDYKRYRLTPGGVSPRGIPGFGEGLVVVDSDEHDEEGHITEDLEMRVKMMDKRLEKEKGILSESVAPELMGSEDFETLLLCWGSTRNLVEEALASIDGKGVSALNFSQLYPVPQEAMEYLTRAKKRIMIESNATSQFANLLEVATGIKMEERILKYKGLPFSVEEVIERVGGILD